MVLPPHSLSQKAIDTIREYTHAMAKELKVVGLMNVQYAVKGETVYVLEVNPRASRTVPFVSKAIGVPLAKLAAKVMAGKTLKELGFTEEIWPKYWAVKESVFPFNKFMARTFCSRRKCVPPAKSWAWMLTSASLTRNRRWRPTRRCPPAAKCSSASATCTKNTSLPWPTDYVDLGFELVATNGTAAVLEAAGLKVQRIYKVSEGRPNAWTC
jgi:carbamoyl-phosphate synthase large subunit